MKKLTIISFLSLVILLFVNAGKESGDNPVVSGKTNGSHPSSTGAPGELTCSRSGCHNGPVFDGAGINLISFGSNDTGYIPGTVYNMKVSVTNFATQKFGFQILALKDADTTSIGTFIITNSTKTQLQNGDVAFGLQSRKYVTHKSAGTQAVTPGYIEWTFNWEAPVSDEGNITFYLATQVTDDNNQNVGDTVYLSNKTISFIDTTKSGFRSLILSLSQISIFPNPAKEKTNLSFVLSSPETVEISLYDVTGKLLDKLFKKANAGEQTLSINTLQYPSGIYFVSLKTSKDLLARKFILK